MRIATESLGNTKVDYINAHGTSTMADTIELGAVERLLGDAAGKVSMSSTKSATGHLLGAAGAIEAIFSTLAIRDNVAPPTLNLDDRLAHTALAEKAAFMRSHPECDVLSVGVLHVESVVSFATAQRMGRMAWFNWKRLEWSRPGLFLGSNPQNPPHNSPFWRKTLQYKVGQGGMFREEYDPVADMEMWMRASV